MSKAANDSKRLAAELAEAGPMLLRVIDPAVPMTREEIALDPLGVQDRIGASQRFVGQLKSGSKPKCLLCDVRWSSNVAANPVRPGAITILCTSHEFRGDNSPLMVVHGLCEDCIKERETLRKRVIEAFKLIWPVCNTGWRQTYRRCHRDGIDPPR